jgi:regulator of sirC expression with transglutaminase-like and TPR domain
MLWKHGDKAKLAAACDISPQYLNDIIKARKGAHIKLAKVMVEQAAKLGYSLGLLDVMDPAESTNPLIER